MLHPALYPTLQTTAALLPCLRCRCRVCNLVLESSSERKEFRRHGRQQYVGRDAVDALHQLLRVQQTQSLDLQAFFDLLQRCGEEKGLLELSNEVGMVAGRSKGWGCRHLLLCMAGRQAGFKGTQRWKEWATVDAATIWCSAR